MIRAAMLTPNLSIGGAERWVATLIANSDPERLKWTGLALSGWGGIEPALCAEVTRTTPIYAEQLIAKTVPRGRPTHASVSPNCERYLRRVTTMEEAVRLASRDADVLVAWGSFRYRNFLQMKETPSEFVLVSHSSHHRAHRIAPVDFCNTHLVSVSERSASPYRYKGNDPVTVLYNGVSLNRIQPRWGREKIRHEWRVTNEKVIGYIGRQTAEKNPDAAIHAMRALDNKTWRAVYYGNKPQGHQGPKHTLIPDAKATRWPYIQFYDPVIDVGDVYAGIDVLMLASNSEAFSLTLLESWLTRVPVVATLAGSVPELQAKHGVLIFEVPFHPTARQLAAACQRAVDPANMGVVERAYQLALKMFTARSMVDRWANYLEEIVRLPAGTSVNSHLKLPPLDL